VRRIPLRDVVVLTGGVVQNQGVVQMLEDKLRRRVLVPDLAQVAGAIGAALVVKDG
jgi:activator of 2-hydroxyglutaryl-CoA dehydratase